MERFRHDSEGATESGEAAVFREAAEFNGAVARAVDLVNGVRYTGGAHVGFVGGIEEDDGFVFPCVINPSGELFAGSDGAGRVIRIAEVDQIDGFFRDGGDKPVFGGAGEINDASISAGFVGIAGVADHDIGVDVNGIDRVGDGHAVAGAEDVEDVAAVALRAVGDKDFVVGDVEPAVAKIVLRDGLAEEVIALFGSVSAEGVAVAEFIDRFVQRLTAGRGEGFGHITDPAANDPAGRVGMSLGESFDPPRNLGKEVAGFEFGIVFVEVGHGKRRWSLELRAKMSKSVRMRPPAVACCPLLHIPTKRRGNPATAESSNRGLAR